MLNISKENCHFIMANKKKPRDPDPDQPFGLILIQEHSDHDAWKELMNRLWVMIDLFFMQHDPNDLRSLILIQNFPEQHETMDDLTLQIIHFCSQLSIEEIL